MVSAYVVRLRLTLATVAADHGGELEAALEVLGLIALKGKVVTADALHCNRCTVAAITGGSGLSGKIRWFRGSGAAFAAFLPFSRRFALMRSAFVASETGCRVRTA